jgi:crotonobetainyl-CoA:carnitine CoA-transferase CaiB-like acyl-CoA transferase
MAAPLSGIRVVDLSQIVSGPMAAAMLADQGAEVIKVETPSGDPVRGFGPAKAGTSAMFVAVNRGKRGIALDLKQPAACAVLWRLIERADVLVENFRPGTMQRLGFGPDACLERNPRLVFASITGFGPDGPYANIRVYDPVIQAVSGIAASQRGPSGEPQLIQTLIADKVTALTAAQAITAALFARARSGKGGLVEVAMLDAAIAFNWPDGMYNHGFQDDPPPPYPEYGAFSRLRAADDGLVAIGALQTIEFVALMRALGLEQLADDPRFGTMMGRIQHRDDWEPAAEAALAAMPLDSLMDCFVREGAVGGRVNPVAAVPDDPQVRHNRIVAEVGHGPEVGRVRVARQPARFGGQVAAPRPAPALGEHGEAILAELGLAADEVAALRGAGALLLP